LPISCFGGLLLAKRGSNMSREEALKDIYLHLHKVPLCSYNRNFHLGFVMFQVHFTESLCDFRIEKGRRGMGYIPSESTRSF
jgi:hypothetical protein